MSSATMGAGARLDIGKVFSQTFGTVKDNFGSFFAMALLLGAVPTLIVGFAQLGTKAVPALGILSVAASIGGLITVMILQGSLIYGTMQSLNGSPAPMNACLRVGTKTWLPLLGLAFAAGIPMIIGFVFFVVPGVLLALRWSVSAPALVMEGRPILAAMGRSAILTKGRRGGIFLIFLIFWILAVVVEAVLFGLLGGAGMFKALAQQNPAQIQGQTLIFSLVASPLINIIGGMLGPAFFGALFHQLRVTREGGAPELLVEVFA